MDFYKDHFRNFLRISPVGPVGNQLAIPLENLARNQEFCWDLFRHFWQNPPGIRQAIPAENLSGIFRRLREANAGEIPAGIAGEVLVISDDTLREIPKETLVEVFRGIARKISMGMLGEISSGPWENLRKDM